MRIRSIVLAVILSGVGMLWQPAESRAQTPPEQKMPAVAYNSNREIQSFQLVWVEDRGKGPDLYGKRLFNNGLPQGGPTKQGIQIIRPEIGNRSQDPGPRSDPSIEYNAQTEEYLLVYSEYTGEEEGWNIFSVRVSAAGYAIGRPREIVGGPGDQQRPDVAVLIDANDRSNQNNRDYLVVYDDNTRDVDEIWALRLRNNNIPRAQPYLLAREPNANASDPTTNGSVVAWVDDRDGQTDIWTLRLRSGKPNGNPYRLAGDDFADDFAPRYGQGGLVWNTYDAATGTDIRGVQVYNNNRTRGRAIGILVPVADQSWPDSAGGAGAQSITVYSDNRSGRYNLYAVRTSNFRRQGREFPVLLDRP